MNKRTLHEVLWWEIIVNTPILWIGSLVIGMTIYDECREDEKTIWHLGICIYCLLLLIFNLCIYVNRPMKVTTASLQNMPNQTNQPSTIFGCKNVICSELFKHLTKEIICILTHLNFYTDVCFISLSFMNSKLWVPSLVFLFITELPKVGGYIYIIKKKLCNQEWKAWIIYLSCIVFDLKGAANILNNIEYDPRMDEMTRIWVNIWNIFTEDLPQMIIQLFYIIYIKNYCKHGVNIIIFISLGISFVLSLYSLISLIFLKYIDVPIVTHAFVLPHEEQIDISRFNLGEKAATQIAKNLRHNSDLLKLNLGIYKLRCALICLEQNGFGNEGTNIIASALYDNFTLRQISLGTGTHLTYI